MGEGTLPAKTCKNKNILRKHQDIGKPTLLEHFCSPLPQTALSQSRKWKKTNSNNQHS
jgi:hypothetical protein